MKAIVLLYITLLFSNTTDNKKDSVRYHQLDLSKSLNIPGLIPDKNLLAEKNINLLPYQIDAIKEKAKNFVPKPVTINDIVTLETSRGTMKLRLYPDIAPKHCENFKKLANSGFYDGTKFHRIIPGFMIQGGDILSRDNDGNNDGHGGPGWTIDAEFNQKSHVRGVLSMARSSNPNSAGSQFFICVADAPHLNGKYTVFGEVINNVHIVDHIVNSTTDYMQAVRMSKEQIPSTEDPDDWITFRDPKTKKQLYSKIPKYKKKSDYEYEMKRRIKSDKPSIPIIIESIRVVEDGI
jgi:peptidyl-prolyl cis-trans isomerase B (cyclophilin B)